MRKSAAASYLLLVICLATLISIALPVLLIQPFRYQTSSAIPLSYWCRRLAVWLSLIGLIYLVLFWGSLWRPAGKLRKSVLIVALLFLTAASWFSRQDYFEWMFHPLPTRAYARPAEADFMADNDMVMAIDIEGDAVAYPVRQLAYHHLVNDVAGGVPIVATY